MEWLLSIVILLLVHAQGRLPNIVFILADDLGIADLSYSVKLYNHTATPVIETPNIDSLADDGIKLESYYTAPICGPSRAALLTSYYPFNLGNPFPVRADGGLDPKFSTIAHELKARGYQNHFVGKWGVDSGGQSYDVGSHRWVPEADNAGQGKGPMARGFDTFYGLWNSGHNHYTKRIAFSIDMHRYDKTQGIYLDWPDVDPEPEVHSSLLWTREAVKIIEDYQGKETPFFLHLSYTAPHDPLQVPSQYVDKTQCEKITSWRRRVYCGMVGTVDEGVGNITKALQRTKLLSDTIVIFTSDNGAFAFAGGRNYPFRGGKAGAHEGGVHVPALIYGPRFLQGGGRIFQGLAHVVDWAPTLLSIIDNIRNVPFSHNLGQIDGIDLSHSLLEGTRSPRTSAVLTADCFQNSTAYIRAPYKLILGHGGSDLVMTEPDSTWEIDSTNRNLMFEIEQLLVDAISIVAKNLFIFEWAVHAFFGVLMDRMYDKGVSAIDLHPDDTVYFRSPNQTFPMVIPVAQWDHPGRVQLYNLEKDPFERNNVAQDHPKIVEEMTKELGVMFAKAPPQIGAIHYMFRILFLILRVTLVILLVITLLLSYCCCPRCCRKSGKTKKD